MNFDKAGVKVKQERKVHYSIINLANMILIGNVHIPLVDMFQRLEVHV